MKMVFQVACCCVFMVLVSCNGNDDAKLPVANRDILQQLPFKAITDSINADKHNPDLLLRRGEMLTQRHALELAHADYLEAWNLRPDENVAVMLISNEMMIGKTEDAISLLKQCIVRYPENPQFRRRLSEAYVEAGRTREAREQYDSLLAKDSLDFETWYEQGLLLARNADTPAAIHALERSYQLQPIQTSGIALANLYAETKSPATIPLCDELLKKDTAKELTDAVFIKGIFYDNTGNDDAAIEQFEDCIRRDWKFTEAYLEKGIILFQRKNMDAALKTFQLASTVSNTNPDAYYWQGRCYEAIGKREDALDNYIRALSLDKRLDEAREGIERLKK